MENHLRHLFGGQSFHLTSEFVNVNCNDFSFAIRKWGIITGARGSCDTIIAVVFSQQTLILLSKQQTYIGDGRFWNVISAEDKIHYLITDRNANAGCNSSENKQTNK